MSSGLPAAARQMVRAVLKSIPRRQPGVEGVSTFMCDVGVAVGRACVQGRVNTGPFLLNRLHKTFERALAAALFPGQVHEVRQRALHGLP